MKLLFAAMLCAMPAPAAEVISLADAEQIALRTHPKAASSDYIARAARMQVAEAQSASRPTVNGYLTGTSAETSTAIAAGNLTTSSISNRAATGVALTQMLTDFGRTSNLTQTAKLRAAAQGQNVATTRAQVILEVRQAYFQALGAESTLQVAQATLDTRRTTLRQIRALVDAQLNSTLDLSFAQVSVSESELAFYQAENESREARARLAAAMGYQEDQPFALSSEITLPPLGVDVADFVRQALQQRPDLLSLQLSRDASQRFAEAERRSRYPSITALAVGGVVPVHDHTLHDSYAAAGINVTLPFLNGGLFSARFAEAELRSQAASKDVQDLSIQISRDVKIAWLEANTAFQRLDVSQRLLAQASETLRLAQARYEAGLGSIVELTQAQLTQTSAAMGAAVAKYGYLSRRANLDYAMGALR